MLRGIGAAESREDYIAPWDFAAGGAEVGSPRWRIHREACCGSATLDVCRGRQMLGFCFWWLLGWAWSTVLVRRSSRKGMDLEADMASSR